jgi:DNA-binding LacI/PurR family transcriptional regulator
MPKNTEAVAVRRGGRRAVASKKIADDLRRQCLRGDWNPGMRVPLRNELIRKYEASATTVQRAIDLLVADGLLEVRGPAGTFVADQPPHLTDVALVFPARQGNPGWLYYYDSLASSAALWRGHQPRRIRVYCCPLETAVAGDLERLRDDMQNMRLAGVIHSTTVPHQDLVQWRQKFDTPFVVLVPGHVLPDAQSAVVVSYDSFFSRAIEFLAQRGRRHLAIVMSPGIFSRMEQEHIDHEAARCGVEIRPMWRQLVGVGAPVCARSVTHLLFGGGAAADRPDGLIVADDNMVSHALLGLQDAGVRPGNDLDVVVHANFPSTPLSASGGVTRLGFDARDILDAGVRLIDTWRQTGKPPEAVELPAVFEHELRGSDAETILDA